jgi:hypothetical protein
LRKILEEVGVGVAFVGATEQRWVLDEVTTDFDDEAEIRADRFFFFETLEIEGVVSCKASRFRWMRSLMRLGAIFLY